MKQLFFFAFFVSFYIARTQTFELWGAAGGGDYNRGVIYKYSSSTQQIQAEKHFKLSYPGGEPFTNGMVKHANGLYYGVTYEGCVVFDAETPAGNGILFEWNPVTNDYRILLDFGDTDASNPVGTLVVYNNLLYGMTRKGGSYGAGTVFRFNPNNLEFRKVSLSENYEGAEPHGSLCIYHDKLFGTTRTGGAGYGTIIEVNPVTLSLNNRHEFSYLDGANPFSGLTVLNNKLYGSTTAGGTDSLGVLFEYNPETITYTKLVDLNNTTGYYIFHKLQVWNDRLYGTTRKGAGLNGSNIFEWNPQSATIVTKHEFQSSGLRPIVLVNEKFIGQNGAKFFEWDPLENTYSELGDYPNPINKTQEFLFDNGKLYWLDDQNGIPGTGSIYEWDMEIDTTIRKISFGYSEEGGGPIEKLIEINGKFYSKNGLGIVEWDPVSESYSTRYKFKSGIDDINNLILRDDGKLYGTSRSGGVHGIGAIGAYDFQIDSVVVLKELDYQITGSNISGKFCSNGDWLYNISSQGGEYNSGVIFAWNQTTNTIIKLYDIIGGQQGYYPLGGMVYLDSVLYGLMSVGGVGNNGGYGTLFSWSLRDSSFSVHHHFYNSGGTPISPQLTVVNGKLYGTATTSNYTEGRIFEFNPITQNFEDIYYFPFHEVAPQDGLTTDGRLLYGVAYNGQQNPSGELFSYNPAEKSYQKLADFLGYNGSRPYMEVLYLGNPTGIDEFVNKTMVVTPNPTESNISFTGRGDGNYELMDLSGRSIRTGPVQANVNTLSLQELAAGTYLLKLKDRGEVRVARIVKK